MTPEPTMRRRAELEGVGWVLLAVFLFLCLMPGDQQWLGRVGLSVYSGLYVLLGVLSWSVPLPLLVLGVARFRQGAYGRFRWMALGYGGCVVSLAALLSLTDVNPGFVGVAIHQVLFPRVGQAGMILIGFAGLIVGLYGLEAERWVWEGSHRLVLAIMEAVKRFWASSRSGEPISPEAARSAIPQRETPDLSRKSMDLIPVMRGNGSDQPEVKKSSLADVVGKWVRKSSGPEKIQTKEKEEKRSERKSEKKRENIRSVEVPIPGAAFQLPPLTLLLDTVPVGKGDDRDAREIGESLVETLKNFGIEARLSGIAPGPVITRYELEPAKGVKVSRFVGLADDIALALKATQVRVVAPIPGKAAVGIEVPNREWELVRLRQLLETKQWSKNMTLPMALGKAIDGSPVVADLADAPHMLIAGATGSGKSVCISGILMSLLYTKTPAQLKLVLIDPKRVEFSLFRDIPHLLTPIITDPRQAAEALKAVIGEMETRYSLLSEVGAQNIAAFNRKVTEKPGEIFDKSGVPVEPFPYIVVCIDELAELMLIAAKEVEEAVMRLAGLARGVGIHLVVATQRPSVDVITGVIKANLPVRVAFQVASKVDSRTILDANGADALLGRGDMLYLAAGAPKPVRAQASFVTKEDIEATVNYLKSQQAPQYKDLLSVYQQKANATAESSEDPAVIRTALQFVVERKRVSTMLLQGALHVSYGRAANMVSWMEMKGLIGPGVGAKPRDVFLDRIEAWLKSQSPTQN